MNKKWTAEELQRLAKMYPIKHTEDLIPLFPGRSFNAIETKALKDMGLHKSEKVLAEAKFMGRHRPDGWGWRAKTHTYTDARGYVMEWDADRGRYVQQHILVMERILGGKIPAGWVVHHIGQPADNRPEMLALMTRSGHTRMYNLQRAETRRAARTGRGDEIR